MVLMSAQRARRFYTLILILAGSLIFSGCAVMHHYGEFTGKVIDKETKEPIEGALVLAEYGYATYTPAGKKYGYLDAKETFTDNNGEYRIPSNIITTFKPISQFYPWAYFNIFKPGYGFFPRYKETIVQLEKEIYGPRMERGPYGYLPPQRHVVIELPKLKTKEERIDNLRRIRVGFDMAYEEQKTIRQMIEEERETVGGLDDETESKEE